MPRSRYAFRHALFQHAALARSTAATVRARHRKIAERLEAGYAGQAEAVAGELAAQLDQGEVSAKPPLAWATRATTVPDAELRTKTANF